MGPVIQPERPPVGFHRDVDLLDRRGKVIDTAEGRFAPFDHLRVEFYWYPSCPRRGRCFVIGVEQRILKISSRSRSRSVARAYLYCGQFLEGQG